MAVSFDRNAALTTLAGFALAALVASRLQSASWVDLALPLWVLLATLPAVGLPARSGSRLAFAVPLLLAIAVMVPGAPLRHLGYGAVIAASFAIGLARMTAGGQVPLRYAARLVVVAASARLFPFEWRAATGLALVLAGTLLLLRWGSTRAEAARRGKWAGSAPRLAAVPLVLLCLALVLVAPVAPLRGALFVPALAAAARVLWGSAESRWLSWPGRTSSTAGETPATARRILADGSLIAAVVAGLLAIFVGKWAMAAVAIVVAARFAGARFDVRNGAPAVAVPGPGSLRAGSGALLFWPGAPLALVRAPMPERLAFAGLLTFSVLARPAPAMLLALGAAILLCRDPGKEATRISAVTGAFAFALLALVPYAGAIGAAFPTLLGWPMALALAVAGSIALLLPPRFGTVLAAAIPVVFLVAAGAAPGHVQPLGQSAGAGERLVIVPSVATDRLGLAISAANVSGLRDGARIGTLFVMDRDGNAWRRELRIGEIADWAAFREGDFFRTLNPRPLRPAGAIEGAGGQSFLRGEGMIPIRVPSAIRRIELAVAEDLPGEVRVHVDRMEAP